MSTGLQSVMGSWMSLIRHPGMEVCNPHGTHPTIAEAPLSPSPPTSGIQQIYKPFFPNGCKLSAQASQSNGLGSMSKPGRVFEA